VRPGLELSQPLVFGLGTRLGFHYLNTPECTPSHFLQGRSAALEWTGREVMGAEGERRFFEEMAAQLV